MSEALIATIGIIGVACVTAFGSIMVALLSSTRKHTKDILDQTENDHVKNPKKISNLRDNIDHNQSLIMAKVDTIITHQETHSNMIASLFQIQNIHTHKIDEITKENPHARTS